MTLADRQMLHIDMDAFYASVEQRDCPELQGRPVLVGGAADRRGVVAACSYEARQFGIHSAMPMSQAHRLCPRAIVLPVRMSKYIEVSKQIHRIFQNYTPKIEPLSIDEAFLDVTGCTLLLGSAIIIGKKIKDEIKTQTGLTASVGVAPNKFLAKLASDLEKPDAFVSITGQNKQQVLDSLPVSKIWGIGRVTNKSLEQIGIHTVKQLRTTPITTLSPIFKSQTEEMLRLARGVDERDIITSHETKSLSAEKTFSRDVEDKDTLLEVLQNQVEEVSHRLRAEKLHARTINLKLRNGEFKTITRNSTLDEPAQTTKRLWEEAKGVFLNWFGSSPEALRLLGFGTSNFVLEDSWEKSLFPDPEEEKQKRIDAVVDTIKVKYGEDALRRGR